MVYYNKQNWEGNGMNICVYGASSTSLKEEYYTAAKDLGHEIAKHGHTLVFGGGDHGLMGACAEGAHQYGGKIIGIAPSFFDEPGILCDYCDEFFYTETMRERKAVMEEHSDAIIAMPGGIGTFEEFFEMLTAKQLGLHAKPMVLLNTLNYYDPLMNMLKKSAECGFMSKRCLEIFSVCNAAADALCAVENPSQLTGSIKRLEDYAK